MAKMVEYFADQIKKDQAQVEGLHLHIKDLYARINASIAENAGAITKSTDSLYKEIDSTFGKKSKLEQNIQACKRQIFVELGIN